MEGSKNHRNRNTALLLIGAGLFIVLEKVVSFSTLVALLLILLGVYWIRSLSRKKGYVAIAIGAVILVSQHFLLVIAIILISLGLFYMKTKQMHRHGSYMRKQKIIESVKRDKEPWVLHSMSMWNIAGEMNLDLSLAMPETEETTIVLQGILGDIDILVPDHYGVHVSASIVFGEISVHHEKDTGVLNKIEWQSANYEHSEHRVKLIISYLVGDIDIKLL